MHGKNCSAPLHYGVIHLFRMACWRIVKNCRQALFPWWNNCSCLTCLYSFQHTSEVCYLEEERKVFSTQRYLKKKKKGRKNDVCFIPSNLSYFKAAVFKEKSSSCMLVSVLPGEAQSGTMRKFCHFPAV